jgi:PAS domain S-box-containing protein
MMVTLKTMQNARKLKFKLFYRVLLLVLLPLCFQVVLVCALSLMLQQAEMEKQHELHAKEVLARVNTLMDSIIESTKVIGMSLLIGGHDVQKKYHGAVDPIPGELASLHNLFKDNPAQLREVDDLTVQTEKSLAVLNTGMKMVDEGDRNGAINELKNMKPLYDNLTAGLDRLRKQANEIANDSPQKQAKNRHDMKMLLMAAVGINIFLAIFFAWSFNRGATRRLSVLVDNTRRLSAGDELHPLVGGGDEIARLDEAFRNMAEQLRVAHDTERSILRSMPIAIAHTMPDGTIVHSNQVLSAMLACTEQELQGSMLPDFFVPSRMSGHSDLISDCLNYQNNEQRENEVEVLAKNGKLLSVSVSFTPFRTTDGARLLAVLQDQTQRKEIERMQRDFVAMISHDLRTPLTAIRLVLDMFSKGAVGDISSSGRERACLSEQNADNLISLVNDYLDLEKLDSGTFELSKKVVKLSDLVDSVVDDLRPLASRKGVKLRFAWEEEAVIEADSARISRVINVLLENAIKASDHGEIVRVELSRRDASISLTVDYPAKAVPDSLKPTIFERYKPAPAEGESAEKGSGLALALCKALVVAHGGEIGLDGGDGGNKFRIELPAAVTGQ